MLTHLIKPRFLTGDAFVKFEFLRVERIAVLARFLRCGTCYAKIFHLWVQKEKNWLEARDLVPLEDVGPYKLKVKKEYLTDILIRLHYRRFCTLQKKIPAVKKYSCIFYLKVEQWTYGSRLCHNYDFLVVPLPLSSFWLSLSICIHVIVRLSAFCYTT